MNWFKYLVFFTQTGSIVFFFYFVVGLPSRLTLIGSLKPCLTKQIMLMMFVTKPNMLIAWHNAPAIHHVSISATWTLISGVSMEETDAEKFAKSTIAGMLFSSVWGAIWMYTRWLFDQSFLKVYLSYAYKVMRKMEYCQM